MARFDTAADLPGQTPVIWRRTRPSIALAVLAGVAWPPLILTLLVWPPQNWLPGRDFDFRLMAMAIAVLAVPFGLWLLARERGRTGRPGTRLGVVWRFMLYGGLLAAALQVVMAVVVMVLGWIASTSPTEAIGATETTLLLYGVAGLPVSILVGVSYALWAGLCAAFIAFVPAPARVKDRLGVMDGAR